MFFIPTTDYIPRSDDLPENNCTFDSLNPK